MTDHNTFGMFCCPKCAQRLYRQEKSVICANGHSYDVAKEGYVNLLLANQKHSHDPGDSKESVRFRKAFLERGYYQSLAEALVQAVRRCLPQGGTVLDAGCGNGYYISYLVDHITDLPMSYDAVDIGKEAVRLCAKQAKTVHAAVAGVFHLPVAANSYDVMLSVFCPYSAEECLRVIKPGGYVIAVTPGKRHLYEMKEIVYEHPYENEEAGYRLPGFVCVSQETVTRTVDLADREAIEALWQMTPYVHTTHPSDSERLFGYEHLQVTTEFLCSVYQKEEESR